MKCKAEGCNLDAAYKAICLCQKHYFRFRRNGDLAIHRKKAKHRIEDKRGYQFIHAPRHPLCRKGQIYVAEHRLVLYAAIGSDPMKCEICGTDHNRQQAWAAIKAQVFPFLAAALQAGGRWVLTIKRMTRTKAQNRRYWGNGVLAQIAEQATTSYRISREVFKSAQGHEWNECK